MFEPTLRQAGPSRPLAVIIFVAVAVGCSDGSLDQPTSPEPAIGLRVRLAQPAPDTVTRIAVSLGAVPYCPSSDVPRGVSVPAVDIALLDGLSPGVPFDRAATTIDLTASSNGATRVFACRTQALPLVRFFQPLLSLSPQPGKGAVPPWIAHDTIIAYADEPATFTSYGPTDEAVALPRGYSILRRTCGSPERPWAVQVGAADLPIDFYPPLSSFYPQPLPPQSALLEQSERSLLEDCGIHGPVLDQGTRVSFDRATSLQFSADGQELVYLMPIDPTDPEQGAPLRSIDLASGATRQLVVIPDGRSFQSTDGGDVYVSTETSLGRAERQPDGSLTIRKLPIPPFAHVSPDGRWIAYDEAVVDSAGRATALVGKLWDVATGVPHVVEQPGLPWGWSPASQLIQFGTGTGDGSDFTYDLVAPEDGQLLARFPSSSLGSIWRLVWGAEGPVVLSAPTHWTPQQPVSRPEQTIFQGESDRDFGLVVEDLRTRAVHDALDAQAGSITFAAGATGYALFWARKCLGLFETACSFDLHRIALPAGPDAIVAVSDSAGPVALSSSGNRLALAARGGIFIRDLP